MYGQLLARKLGGTGWNCRPLLVGTHFPSHFFGQTGSEGSAGFVFLTFILFIGG
jgi:hypothetical protein